MNRSESSSVTAARKRSRSALTIGFMRLSRVIPRCSDWVPLALTRRWRSNERPRAQNQNQPLLAIAMAIAMAIAGVLLPISGLGLPHENEAAHGRLIAWLNFCRLLVSAHPIRL